MLDRCNVAAKVRLAAFEAAIVESGVHNLPYGDRDSLGVFQQRPVGWGTARADHGPGVRDAQVRLSGQGDRAPLFRDPGVLAQKVQRSAHPERYAQRAGQAAALNKQFCG